MRPTTVRLPWDVEGTSNGLSRSTPSTLCLRTPGGDLWISQARWERLPCGDDDAGLLGAVLEFLQAAGSAQDSAQVPVSRVGPGSSRLNCRLDFAVNRITAAGVPDGVVRRRSESIAAQVGPGALAGLMGWSVWYAVAWGIAVAFYSAVIKSNVGRGLASGNLPKHWLPAIAITLPIGALAFCALNIGAWWLAGWLFR